MNILGFLAILAVIMLLENIFKSFRIRESVDPWAEIRDMTSDEYDEYIQDHLENQRVVNGFVLTRAIIPIEAKQIRICEGYKFIKAKDENGEPKDAIVAVVSAEKIWYLLVEFITSLGEVCHVQIQDFEDKDDVRFYVARDQRVTAVIDILSAWKDMVMNHGMMNLWISGNEFKPILYFEYHKHFIFESDDPELIANLLHSCGIKEDKSLQPFSNSSTINLNEWENTGALVAMVQQFENVENYDQTVL